tara:strand:- start:181 stop:354 length:174 start_codon:yes stop_codon:yes gene_type:complete
MDIKTAKYCQDPLIAVNSGVIVTTQTDEILVVPLDTGNRDYQAIQEWVADGNTITAA